MGGCGAVVRLRWWWWWGSAFAKREVRGGWTAKPEIELPWLGFGLQLGCMRWRGELWGHNSPSRAKIEGEDGG
jgi:hypothetical protein